MVKEPTPASGDDVPDVVLEELLSAFADEPKPAAPAGASGTLDDSAAQTGHGAGTGASRRSRRGEKRAARKAAKRAAKDAAKEAKKLEKGAKKAAKVTAKSAEKATAAKAKETAKAAKAAKKAGTTLVEPAEPVAGVAIVKAPTGTTTADPVSAGPAAPSTIVIGGDDDLPDIVYLDEVVEGEPERGGRSTISIGDDLDSTGAFDAVSPASRTMDPRVRARRIAVKRAKGRKRLLWIGAVVGVLLVLVAGFAVLGSSLFAVEEVTVQGNVYTDPERLQAVVDDLTGEPVLLVDTLAAERRLEEIPWVERAIVTTTFPNKVLIDIRERVPLASFRGSDGRYRVIDRDGRVLDVLDGQPVDYLLITGQAPDTGAGGYAGAPFAAAAQLVAALPEEIRSITKTASVDAATGDLGLVLEPNIEVRVGSATGLDGKLARLLQRVRDGLLGIVAIDVSTDEVSITRG